MEANTMSSKENSVKKRVFTSEGSISANIYGVTPRPALKQQYKLILNGEKDFKYRLCEFNYVEYFVKTSVTLGMPGFMHDTAF